MDNRKMQNLAGTLDTIVKVCGEILRAMGIVCVVFAVLVGILGEKMFAAGSLTLELDFIKVYIAQEMQEVSAMLKLYTILALLAICVLCFAAYGISVLLRKILLPMKEGRPFDASVPLALNRMSWVVLAGGAAAQIIGMIARMVMARAYPMEEIFSSSAVEKIETVYSMDFSFVLLFCVIRLLAYVFAYGQQLQKESDETL